MERSKRDCLKCGKPFQSSGTENRLCTVCNQHNRKLRLFSTTRVIVRDKTKKDV